MAMARGLGKGLGALLGSTYEDQKNEKSNIGMLHVKAIHPSTLQPRKAFAQKSLEELSHSIIEQGVLQPVLVRVSKNSGMYELVAGERRWRAAQLAGIDEIPAIVRDMSDKESLELALIENIHREDLNAMEQATALQQLQQQFQVTQQELSQRVGLSRSHIANMLRLLQLPPEIQDDLRNQLYTPGHGRVLMSITNPESQQIMRSRIVEVGEAVRVCELYAAHWKKTGQFPFQKKRIARSQKEVENQSIADYENMMLAQLGVKKVRLKGNLERGSVTISYVSNDEFTSIIKRLGIEVIDAD